MRYMRRIIGDAMSGGVLAALLLVMLTLQGAIGAYAQAAVVPAEMAAASGTPAIVICASHGLQTAPEKHPLDGTSPDCCTIACQFACSLGPGLPSEGFVLNDEPAIVASGPADPTSTDLTPYALGLSGQARAPPSLSI
jgi:hypothetical protein